MALVAAAFPIPPGKMDEWRAFVAELNGARRSEYVASRKRLGVHERTFLQPTPMGDLVVVTVEGDHADTMFQRAVASTDPFDRWFVERVEAIHGVDMAAIAAGPMPTLVADAGA